MKHAKLYIILSIIIVLNIVYIFIPKSTYVCYTDEATLNKGMFAAKHEIYYELSNDDIMTEKDSFCIRNTTEYDYIKMWKFKAEDEGTTNISFYSIYQDEYKWDYSDGKVINVRDYNGPSKGMLVDVGTITVANGKFVENYTLDYILLRYRVNICIIAICIFLVIVSKLKIMGTMLGRTRFINNIDRVLDILLLLMVIMFFQTRLYAPFVVLAGMVLKRIFIWLDNKKTVSSNIFFTVIMMLFVTNILLQSSCVHIVFLPIFLFAVSVVVYAYIGHITGGKKEINTQESREYVSCEDKLKEKIPFVKKLPLGVLSYLLWVSVYICTLAHYLL